MQNEIEKFDVAIIGAGAAGMMCAIEAGKRGRSVLIIEHTHKVGEKIRISGGGKCNFTNLNIETKNFLSQNPKFAMSALSRFSQHDFIDLVKSHDIAYHEKTSGQLFCDKNAEQIISMLTKRMKCKNVCLKLNSTARFIQKNEHFRIILDDTEIISSSLVIACGGKSIPKIGASDFGYLIAQQFNLNVVETRPALVPLLFSNSDLNEIKSIVGLSLNAKVGCDNVYFDEGFLFTHRGLSGPSILQISSYWREGKEIKVNLCPELNIAEALMDMKRCFGSRQLETVLSDLLPNRLARLMVNKCGLSGNLADQSKKNVFAIKELIQNWVLKPSGSEGYRKAEVTLGGVSTDELNPKTMESIKVKGLFFIGEVVDITGWLGGYNFQWAWSSGWVAGNEV